ncbi:MAG: hypothetical protein KAT34_12110, partial [Candidatus Aminicenantes bacterium]|nr:hypothetical protein [Candidatus Aminicenantes bacterium]
MKTWTIIKKEYKQIVKKKSFVIATLLTPALMAGFIFLPLLLTKVGREEKTIEIADFSGIIRAQFIEKSAVDETAKKNLKLTFKNTTVKDSRQHDLLKDYAAKAAGAEGTDFPLLPEYRKKILKKEIDGLILIPGDVKSSRRVFFCALNISDFGTNEYI